MRNSCFPAPAVGQFRHGLRFRRTVRTA